MRVKLIRFIDGSIITPEQPCGVSELQKVPGFIAVQNKNGVVYYSQSFVKFIVTEWENGV